MSFEITDQERLKLMLSSAYSLPNSPTQKGMTASEIKEKLYKAVFGKADSLVVLINEKLNAIQEQFGLEGEALENLKIELIDLMNETIAKIDAYTKIELDAKIDAISNSKVDKRTEGSDGKFLEFFPDDWGGLTIQSSNGKNNEYGSNGTFINISSDRFNPAIYVQDEEESINCFLNLSTDEFYVSMSKYDRETGEQYFNKIENDMTYGLDIQNSHTYSEGFYDYDTYSSYGYPLSSGNDSAYVCRYINQYGTGALRIQHVSNKMDGTRNSSEVYFNSSGMSVVGKTMLFNGKQVATTAELQELKESLVKSINYKGSVATYNDLPTTNTLGDLYNTLDTGDNYIWDGTTWDKLGSNVDLTLFLTKEEAKTTYARKSEIPDMNQYVMSSEWGEVNALLDIINGDALEGEY